MISKIIVADSFRFVLYLYIYQFRIVLFCFHFHSFIYRRKHSNIFSFCCSNIVFCISCSKISFFFQFFATTRHRFRLYWFSVFIFSRKFWFNYQTSSTFFDRNSFDHFIFYCSIFSFRFIVTRFVITTEFSFTFFIFCIRHVDNDNVIFSICFVHDFFQFTRSRTNDDKIVKKHDVIVKANEIRFFFSINFNTRFRLWKNCLNSEIFRTFFVQSIFRSRCLTQSFFLKKLQFSFDDYSIEKTKFFWKNENFHLTSILLKRQNFLE